MKILVANLGSTSFKYRLFDMADERQLARGGVERIGSRSGAADAPQSRWFAEIGSNRSEGVALVPDHAVAVRQCLEHLTDPNGGCLHDAGEVSAIGFKAVHGGRLSGVQRVTPEVLAAMEEMNHVAPAHNPPYVAAMRLLSERLPGIPLVAAFETGFHQTIPPRLRNYAIPQNWAESLHIERWGFHGASHRYIATRTAQLVAGEPSAPLASGGKVAEPSSPLSPGGRGAGPSAPLSPGGRGAGGEGASANDLRIISCHLGGSSSVCAIRGGRSVATSMGMSPQSGLPQNNRVGDFDPFALPLIVQQTGKSLDEVLHVLAEQGGLLGISGTSGDVRDLETAAAAGDERAQLALDIFTTSVRHYLGAYLVELGGADAIVFTGGIGENSAAVRSAVCQGLKSLGILLDAERNTSARGESRIDGPDSRVQLWIMPTNEELVVAWQCKQFLESAA
ncbi:MAG TPA: acetate/propionate family kinase [Pirellulales bacterium]|jgi:acetate kinase|nr:acetate/propionate family kinase [Pirellulales bacterium]